jgi:hypothetical protein
MPASEAVAGVCWEPSMERKIFWLLFATLGLAADFMLPLYWSLALTLPLLIFCWWVAYRSGWFS